MQLLVVLATLALGMNTAQATDRTVECTAEGKSLSQSGGQRLEARASLTFIDTVNAEGVRTLKNITGTVRTLELYESEDLETDYVGNFEIPSLSANPKYHPRRYQGYSQFRKFNATDTQDSYEQGMWGNFVIEPSTSEGVFSAHYIFQAGDHMGGTLHLTCRAVN